MSNEIVVAERSEIAALQEGNDQLDALMYNIQIAGGVSESDIRRVKNPSGGGLMFEIGKASGDPDYVRELIGIPLFITARRTLWADKAIGSKERPVCSSNNLIDGVKRKDDKTGAVSIPQNILDIAIPGGDEGKCAGCYFNEFDTGIDSNGKPTAGKRCQESRVVYFLRVGDVLPVKITVPSGSLGVWNTAIKQVPVRIDQAVIKLWLTKEKSKSGIEFAGYKAELVKKLNATTIEALNSYRKMFEKVFDNATADRTDDGVAGKGRRKQADADVSEDTRF